MCRMVTAVSTSVLYPGNWLREWISGILAMCTQKRSVYEETDILISLTTVTISHATKDMLIIFMLGFSIM